jgi:hypothetical protein
MRRDRARLEGEVEPIRYGHLEVVMSRSYYRIGLVVLAAMSVIDLLGPLFTDGSHPPMSVALVGAAIGLASLALVPSAWRGSRRAAWILVGLRLLSALSAVPAFFVSDAPAPAVGLAGGLIAVTVAGAVLVVAGIRRVDLVGAR